MQRRASPTEMLVPSVGPGVKQSVQLGWLTPHPREVWAFVGVAAITCPGKICRVIVASVLFSNDMVNLKWEF